MKNFKCLTLAATGLSAMLAAHCVPVLATQHEPPKDSGQGRMGKTGTALSIERISAEPDTDQQAGTLRWSPDGARIAWMHLVIPPENAHIKTPQQEIWTFSSETGAQVREHPALLVSTTKVTNSLRGTDAPIQPKMDEDDDSDGNPFLLRNFAWSQDHASLLLIGSQSLAWLDLASGKSKILISGDENLADVSVSPDGRTVGFVRNHSLWVVDAQGGPARILAKSAHEDLLEGELDWPYRNELHLARAYNWSPDSSSIAYLETDDRAVAKYALHSSDGDAREIVYPKPGGELPIIRVFVKRIGNSESSAPVEIDLGSTKGFYLPRMTWLPDGRHLAIERLDRRQQTLELFLADALSGKPQLLLTEKDKYWINLSDDLYFLKDSKGFLWSSERTGFRHLYLYDMQGKQLAQLTHGDWEVTSLDAVDEVRHRVYFTATEQSPLERHLYAVSLDGSGMERITHRPGTHEVSFAPNGQLYADCYSNQTTPPRLSLLETDKSVPAKSNLDAAKSAEDLGAPPLQPAEFLTVKMHLGMEVHAFIIKPPSFDPARKYPVIVYMAGGPGEQLVRDAWGGPTGLWMRSMAEKGYIVFALDNQGTAARGHYFEEPIHLRLSAQELGDQRDGVNYLRTLPYIDSTRLGVCGWGYGGFLVVHAMLDRPVAFRAGFAGAPIVDWRLYDAVFGERYLDDPVVHADGWDSSTAFGNRSTHFFKGSLMIAQGTEDEFVHMENTLTLQDRLLDAGKSADILLMPDRGHYIEDLPARQLLFTRMTEFFLKNL
jgi:dipeptidyl-peptidase 4